MTDLSHRPWATTLPSSPGPGAPWRPRDQFSLVMRHVPLLSFPCKPRVSVNKCSKTWWLEALATFLYIRGMWPSTKSEKYFKRLVSEFIRKMQGKTHSFPSPLVMDPEDGAKRSTLPILQNDLKHTLSSMTLTKIIHTLDEAWNSNSLSFHS